jgi:hypothetical protein
MAVLNRTLPGFCALVPREAVHGDCERDATGIVRMHGRGSVLQACAEYCSRCARCRFLSASAKAEACAWYASCNTNDLRSLWVDPAVPWVKSRTFDWQTIQIRHEIPLPMLPRDPPPPSRFHVAIATLSLGSKQSCAMTGWCQAAHRLKRALTTAGVWRVQLVVLYGPLDAKLRVPMAPATAACPDAEYVPVSRRLQNLTRQCIHVDQRGTDSHGRRFIRRAVHTTMASGLLFKWQPMSWTQYDCVLLADLDVDVLPIEFDAGRVGERWRRALAVLTQSTPHVDSDARLGAQRGRMHGMHLVGSTDHEAPLNTGILLIRPSRALYRDGLRVLQECRFNETHGWGLVGPPQSLKLAPPRFFTMEGTGSTSQLPLRKGSWPFYTPLNDTVAYRKNFWRFIAGAEDQGFFWCAALLCHRASCMEASLVRPCWHCRPSPQVYAVHPPRRRCV